MTRKFIILSVVPILFVAPVIAWSVVDINHKKQQEASKNIATTTTTKDELLGAIHNNNTDSHVEKDNDNSYIHDIVSFKVMKKWWYIVKVNTSIGVDDQLAEKPMLMVKFTDDADSVRMVTEPGEPLPLHNISNGLGIPYDVIDEYNKLLGK